jgi:hypothetical protein
VQSLRSWFCIPVVFLVKSYLAIFKLGATRYLVVVLTPIQ